MSTPASRNQLWFVEHLIPANVAFWKSMADKLAAGEFTDEDVHTALSRSTPDDARAAEAVAQEKIRAAEIEEENERERLEAEAAAAEATAGQEPDE